MSATSKYENVEIFLVHQPHKAQTSSSSEIQKALSDETLFSDISIQPLSGWQQQGDRVWSRVYKGAFTSTSEIYDVRRKHLPSYLQNAAIDVVALPLDSAPPSSSTTSTSTTSTRRPIRLAVFDMDSTLIEQEVIDELARAIGKYDAVAAITERAMQGHLDFAGSLRERVALLRGLPHDVWETVKPRISFSAGARQLCRELKRQGATLAVLSGGFTPLAEWVKAELGLDVAHANFLASDPPNEDFDFEHLNGRLVEGRQIVTAERKRELLLDLATKHGCPLSQVLCVGDGANDLNMLGEVGQGGGVAIALKAKPKVQEAAPNKLNSESMVDILYLLGYTQKEIEALGSS